MPDSLRRIFHENLYPKSKDRNWERRADRCGDEVEGMLNDLFKHQEDALLGTIHAMGSLIMLAKKEKRVLLLERVKDAIMDRIVMFQEDEEEFGPGDEEEDDAEDIENVDDVDFKNDVPERPSPEPDEDGDDDMGDEDPNQSEFNNNPTKVSGYQPKKRRPENPR